MKIYFNNSYKQGNINIKHYIAKIYSQLDLAEHIAVFTFLILNRTNKFYILIYDNQRKIKNIRFMSNFYLLVH